MKLLEGLLPIIPEKEGLRPITFKNKASIQAQLNEEARLERLARMSINKDPTQLVLEPIAHSLFDVFDLGTEKDSTVESSAPDILKLIPLNGLSVMRDTDTLDKNRVLAQLDIKAYQERRKAQAASSSVNIISIPEETIYVDEDGDINMDSHPSEEYLPNTQDVNQMIESILGPDSAMEGVVQTAENSVALSQPEAILPQPNPPAAAVTTHSTLTQREPVVDIAVHSDKIISSSVPIQPPAVTPTEPTISAQPTTSTQPTPQEQFAAQAQPLSPVQTTPSVTPTSPVQSTVPVESGAPVQAAAPVSAQPSAVVETEAAEVTVPETTTVEQSQDEDMTENSSAFRWFTDDTITTEDLTSDEKVYAYEREMIPIFATLNQQDQCEKVTRASQTAMGSLNFDKPISVLNFSSNLDLTVEKLWNQSGKLMFLKSLLKGLLGKDVIILLVAHDLGEEEALVNLFGENLKLDCVRMNYLLDDDWNGEYGVFVKTMLKVDQTKETAKRGNDFSRSADLIICMDIRVNRNHELFSKVTRRNNDSAIPPPVAWLVTLGSVEERVFEHLKKNNTQYSGSKTPDLKELLRMSDDWPVDEAKSTAELNTMVAENVQAWLLSSGKDVGSYQYRSTVHLPKSIHYANLKSTVAVTQTTTTSTEEETVTSDMDIASDSEEAVEEGPVREVSQNLSKYINEILFPSFDTKRGHLSKPNTSAVKLSGKNVIFILKTNIFINRRG
ncbi:uncharacterized protein EV154DRAFT_521835 [Mucor mucedo]|uniref:uncharacterized protein n=1 Tax=Mucor mucedo TaxID=29922 RepID=UPI0022207C02|nr:uncharacterized protein EV154DRAFT_521835 [Mucor mucedo]KAI7885474.1 hypothetical protein EV154DRAFT_521835 [Mucor mucedo]